MLPTGAVTNEDANRSHSNKSLSMAPYLRYLICFRAGRGFGSFRRHNITWWSDSNEPTITSVITEEITGVMMRSSVLPRT